MGIVRMMSTSATPDSTATVVAARVAGRLARQGGCDATSGAAIALAPHAYDPEMEDAVDRLRRLRDRGLLTAHEFEIALDRVTGRAIS
jgi:hypothetical protein